MLDNIEKELRACQETPEGNTEKQVDRIYDLLTKLPPLIKHGLQCFIYDCPLTKPIKENNHSLPDDDYD